MKKIFLLLMVLLSSSLSATPAKKLPDTVKVKMKTTYGEITLELNRKKAPLTVKNFLRYTKEGFYDDTIFHRVISGFMIQGGGLNADLSKKTTHKPIQNEATNGLKNEVGTIAMARTGAIHSATAQFFINTNNNSSLDHTSKSQQGYGYAVFGRVIDGMPIVNKIKLAKTKSTGGRRDVPVQQIKIKSIIILK